MYLKHFKEKDSNSEIFRCILFSLDKDKIRLLGSGTGSAFLILEI